MRLAAGAVIAGKVVKCEGVSEKNAGNVTNAEMAERGL